MPAHRQASELAYTVVKCAGAAYLIWLGTRMLWNISASIYVAPERIRARRNIIRLRCLVR
jgi:threonine/homoserine/homoserine lactone efflux protein